MFKSQVESPLQNPLHSLLTDTPPILGLTRACLYDVRQLRQTGFPTLLQVMPLLFYHISFRLYEKARVGWFVDISASRFEYILYTCICSSSLCQPKRLSHVQETSSRNYPEKLLRYKTVAEMCKIIFIQCQNGHMTNSSAVAG